MSVNRKVTVPVGSSVMLGQQSNSPALEPPGLRVGLELVDTKTFGTGVVHLIYRPSGKEGEG